MKKVNDIRILKCERVNNEYHLKYESKKILKYCNYDLIVIKDTENNSFIASIKSLKENILKIYMSVQYENSIVGDIETQLLFSPLTSIEGASEIVKITETFPPCHYEKIMSYQEKDNSITLQISLEYYNRIMKLSLFDIKKNQLTDYQETNIIFQLEFRNNEHGIEVEIDSIEGLYGTLICKRVKAELMPNC